MAAGLKLEPLDKGLVNARDPSLLQPGELQQTDNACYKPNSLGLHKSPSNSQFNVTAVGTNTKGLRYCAFDFVSVAANVTVNAITITPVTSGQFAPIPQGAKVRGDFIPDDVTVVTNNGTQIILSAAATASGNPTLQFEATNLLVSQANNAYNIAPAGTSGTFTQLVAVTEGEQLESVHYENKHFLLNGKNVNKVLLSNQTVREHGLKPVAAAPTLVTAAGGWAVETGTGWYSYWTTEYDKANDVESDFIGKPAVINVPNTTTKVTITRPNRVNTSATHWRVYRSLKLGETTATQSAIDQTNGFPFGNLVATMELKDDGTQNSVDDGGAVSSTTARIPGVLGPFTVTLDGVTWQNNTTSAPTVANFQTVEGNYNRVVNSITSPVLGRYANIAIELGNFGFTAGNITALPITGIQVAVTAKKAAGNPNLRVAVLGKGASFFPGLTLTKNNPLTAAFATVTLGTTSDRWGGPSGRANFLSPDKDLEWTMDDMTDGNFRVILIASVPSNGDEVQVDRVTVTVSFGGGQQVGTLQPFPALTVKPFGVTISTGRNGPPPKSSTGDIFQDSLVVNDVTDESIIRYSWPAKPDAFPTLYFLNFETKDQDRVTLIKTVGNNMVVGLSSQIYRVQYLPRDTDAEFDRGRAIELIENNHGIVGPMAGCVFSMQDGAQILAYVSRFGLHRTDTYRTTTLTNDLNWESMVDLNNLSRTVIINNPERYELQVYYVPRGSATPTLLTRRIRLSYHPLHIKGDGGLKVSGPDTGVWQSAALAVLRDGSRPLYTGSNTGRVFLENQGSYSTMTLKSRQMYLAGAGGEWKYDGLYVHHTLYATSGATSPMNIDTNLDISKQGTSSRVSATKSIAVPAFTTPADANYPQDRQLSYCDQLEAGEGIATTLAPASSQLPLSIDYFVVKGQDFGEEMSLK